MVSEFWEPVEALHSMLDERGYSLSVAESCTAGLLGAALTSVPGSSKYFKGGIIAYINTVKETLLDVSPATLEEDGAVSDATAEAMARGANRHLDSDVALSITGIAGPAGGTETKPVGLVFFGCVTPDDVYTQRANFEGDRTIIRKKSVNHSLEMARNHL